MNLTFQSHHRQRVDEFRRKHRIALLTLLFTDIVGSTRIKQELGDRNGIELIKRHHALVRDLLKSIPDAEEIDTAGDSFFLVFAKPSDAVRFSLALQSHLRKQIKETPLPVLDRIGIHLGEVFVEERDEGPKCKDLFGIQIDTCARVMGLGQGNQILMTRAVFDNARQVLKGEDLEGIGELTWLNHGPYVLKGIEDSIEICETGETQTACLTPPVDTEKAYRHISPDQEPVLGWRPAIQQTVLGTQWELVEKLGEGGFGEVWKARHRSWKEERVFKFCFRADRVRALRREVTIFRILKDRIGDHPHIVKLHDVFFDEPPYYIVTEYVSGHDLVQWSESQGGADSIPFETRLEIAAQTADALQAAHDAGVIHRDIKPTNILVKGQGTKSDPVQIKLTDFGIGQLASQEGLPGVTQAGFTQTLVSQDNSSRSGTLLYLAPEVLEGKPATLRSDLYSLGVVFYQLFIGDFSRPLTTDWKNRIKDPLLREDLHCCFAEEPDERFGSANELSANLRALEARRHAAAEQERLEHSARWRRRVSMVIGIVCIAAVLIAVSLGYGLRQAVKAKNTAEHERYLSNLALAEKMQQDAEFDNARETLLSCPHNQRSWEWGRLLHLGQQDICSWDPHQGGNSSVRYDSIGETLFSSGWTDNLKAWDTKTGRIQKEYSFDMAKMDASLPWIRMPVKSVGGMDSEGVLTAGPWRWDISPDSKRIAIGGMGFVLIDRESGEMIQKSSFDAGVVFDIAFNTDGTQVAVAQGSTAMIYDGLSGHLLLKLIKHAWVVKGVAFISDGNRLITGDDSGVLRVWNTASGELIDQYSLGDGEINQLLVYNETNRLAVVHSGKVKLWNIETWKEIAVLESPPSALKCVAFSPDGKWLATGGDNHRVTIWDGKTFRERLTLAGHSSPITSVAFRPDGKELASCEEKGILKSWNLASRVELAVPSIHAMDESKTPHKPFMPSPYSSYSLFDLHTKTNVFQKECKFGRIAFTKDDRYLFTLDANGTIQRIDASNGQLVNTIGQFNGDLADMECNEDGTRLATLNSVGIVTLWNPIKGGVVKSFDTEPVTKLPDTTHYPFALDPKGEKFITGYFNAMASVWDIDSGTFLFTLDFPSNTENSPSSGEEADLYWQSPPALEIVKFSPNGERISIAGYQNNNNESVLFGQEYDAQTGEVLKTVDRGTQSERLPFNNKDDTKQVAIQDDGSMHIVDPQSKQILATLTEPLENAALVMFAASDSVIIGFNQDGQIRTWDTASGKILNTFSIPGLTLPLESVKVFKFGADDTHFALIDYRQNKVEIWNLLMGEKVYEMEKTPYSPNLSFSPGGRYFVNFQSSEELKQVNHTLYSMLADLEIIKTRDSFWDTQNACEMIPLKGTSNEKGIRAGFYQIGFDRNVDHVAAIDLDTIRVWNTHNGQPVKQIKLDGNLIYTAVFSPNLSFVALDVLEAFKDRKLVIWDIDKQKVLHEITGMQGIGNISFSPLERLIAVIYNDDNYSEPQAKFFEIESGKEIALFKKPLRLIQSLAISPDEKLIAVSTFDQMNQLKLYYYATGQEKLSIDLLPTQAIKSFPEDMESIENDFFVEQSMDYMMLPPHLIPGGISFSPDGRYISFQIEKETQLYDTRNGQLVTTLRSRNGYVDSQPLFGINNRLLTLQARMSSTVTKFGLALWDFETGRHLISLTGYNKDGFVKAAINKDQRRILAVSSDGILYVWHSEALEELDNASLF